MINIKYHSQAVRLYGYESTTLVSDVYHINDRQDFDIVLHRSRGLYGRLKRLIQPYMVFIWALFKFDVFNFYFNGGLLQTTSLALLEFHLLRLAGKKIVVTAYGADVQLANKIPNLLFKHAFAQDYPHFFRDDLERQRKIYHIVKHAHCVVAGVDWVDFIPRWDKLIAGHFAIDTEYWSPKADPIGRRPFRILHAPNHRAIKGTEFLERACAELQAEGYELELIILERVKNAQIREAMWSVDAVADQFIVGWYAMFAIEGMALAKPVLTYLREDLLELYSLYSFAHECPIVNTPVMAIKENLRRLMADPQLCRELGARGRQFVLECHSLERIGGFFDAIYRELYETPRRPSRRRGRRN
jgi:glycosyltransferase involved in cell wall biosynthesis